MERNDEMQKDPREVSRGGQIKKKRDTAKIKKSHTKF